MKWIKCEDEQPQEGLVVLVCYIDSDVKMIATGMTKEGKWLYSDVIDNDIRDTQLYDREWCSETLPTHWCRFEEPIN